MNSEQQKENWRNSLLSTAGIELTHRVFLIDNKEPSSSEESDPNDIWRAFDEPNNTDNKNQNEPQNSNEGFFNSLWVTTTTTTGELCSWISNLIIPQSQIDESRSQSNSTKHMLRHLQPDTNNFSALTNPNISNKAGFISTGVVTIHALTLMKKQVRNEQYITSNDIKQLYRKGLLKYHPDKFSGNPQNFIDLQTGYELLIQDQYDLNETEEDRAYRQDHFLIKTLIPFLTEKTQLITQDIASLFREQKEETIRRQEALNQLQKDIQASNIIRDTLYTMLDTVENRTFLSTNGHSKC